MIKVTVSSIVVFITIAVLEEAKHSPQVIIAYAIIYSQLLLSFTLIDIFKKGE